ncbi:kelch-like protein 18 [Styela clava]
MMSLGLSDFTDIESEETFSTNGFGNNILTVFEQIRREGKMCDVVLKVEGGQFSAHRIVLAASIPYFNSMFTTDMVEANMPVIPMQGIDVAALEAIINYAYSGRITLDITNVQSILVGANFLQLQNVKDYCCEFIKKRLHPTNCLGIRHFAELLMCGSLVEKANSFIEQRFLEVTKSQEYLQLSLDEVTDLLARNEINVSSEEQVFHAATVWIKEDPTERTKLMQELLQYIRLPLLRPQFLTDVVQMHHTVKTCLKCRDLVDKAKDYHLMPERRYEFPPNMVRPRCCTDVHTMIYAVGGLTSSGEALNIVEKYDPIVGRWVTVSSMKTCRSRVGVAVLAGQLYAVGGYDGSQRLKTVEMFSPDTNEWCDVKPMNMKRSALGCVALDGEIFVCGGFDGTSSQSSCEVYKPHTQTWELIKPMQKGRSAAAVGAFERNVYVLGGHDGLQIFNSVEYYVIEKNEWTMGVPMLTKRCRHGVATLRGILFVFGGYDGKKFLDSVELFDPVTCQWCFVAPMSMRRSRVGVSTSGGKIYALGGYDGCSNLSSVEVYDPETNTWKLGDRMWAHEGGVGVGAIALEPV